MSSSADEHDLSARQQQVLRHFPTSLGVDDFMARVEVVLSGYGFTGDNSIAMTNLCRDEVTSVLKDKIETAFGSSFNTNGLGGVLTCGVTGIKAGLSHSPTTDAGRERYVFFSFPHIAIDGTGHVGAIARPGREAASSACGALLKCLTDFQGEGYDSCCKVPGVHDPLDPELSILKQRLARRLRYERTDMTKLDLASITQVAERTITTDLEFLIEKAVDHNKADYAVVTGVQVHNWATTLDGGAPSLEFVAPAKVFVVVDGTKIHLDLSKVPSLSPRQLLLLSSATKDSPSVGLAPGGIYATSCSTGSTLQEIPFNYLARRLGGASFIDRKDSSKRTPGVLPVWQSSVRVDSPLRSRNDPPPTDDSIQEDWCTWSTSFQVSSEAAAGLAEIAQQYASRDGASFALQPDKGRGDDADPASSPTASSWLSNVANSVSGRISKDGDK